MFGWFISKRNLLSRLLYLEVQVFKMAKSQQNLDDAIAALPGKLTAALEEKLRPIIQALEDKIAAGNPVADFQTEVDALEALPQAVSESVTADLTPAA